MELEQIKVRAIQTKNVSISLSMNVMVEAIKVLQTIVVNERNTKI
jgi:hypothetical protein